jgi:hypothetical protein
MISMIGSRVSYHGHIGRARGQDAVDTGAGQATAPDPPDAADPAILPRQLADHVPGAIGGIVVDEDDFPGFARQCRLQPPVQRGDVVALVEGGDDDRKLRRNSGLRRVFGGRSGGVTHAASVYPQHPDMPRQLAKTTCKVEGPNTGGKAAKTGQNRPRNANDHEQRARVHPALPGYSVVVPAPELLSIDVAVRGYIGAIGALRKGYVRNALPTSSLRPVTANNCHAPRRRGPARRDLSV